MKDVLKKLSKIVPMQICLSMILMFAKSIQPAILVIVEARFIDGVIDYFVTKGVSIDYLIKNVVFMIILIAFLWVSDDIIGYIDDITLIKIRKVYKPEIIQKVASLKYRYIENEEACSVIARASDNPEEKIFSCYLSYRKMFSFIIKIGSILSIMLKYQFISTIIILVLIIPLFIVAVKSGKANYLATQEVTAYKRKADYLSQILLNKESVYERTLFSYTSDLNDKWYDKFDTARRVQLKTSLKWFIKNKMGSVLTALIGVIVTIVLLPSALSGIITVGLYISLLNAVYSMVQVMSWEFTDCVDQLSNVNEYLKDLKKLYNFEQDIGTLDLPEKNFVFESLVFNNVSFKYPNMDNYVLKNLSFKIEKNKQYSFVGINGAGKTTIIKLLLKMYDNYFGEILINNIELQNYRLKEIKAVFHVVFQDFAKYSNLTIGENIAMGAINQDDIVDEDVDKIMRQMGIEEFVRSLNKGKYTKIGAQFEEGTDLSGGQWQRVAMARGLIGNSDVCILDEPTASLDPINESKFYESIQWLSDEKTTILITHRLASARYSDFIYVIQDGGVVEKGKFDDLISKNGIFAEMYNLQRSWYNEGAK